MPSQANDIMEKKSDPSKETEYRFFTPESIEALKDFKYNGEDHSLVYKYILSPLAGYLVDHATPPTVAPNTITSVGFAFMVLAYALMQKECPTFDHCTPDRNPPGYIFLVNGISLLIYQTLDNMDGKQARKTGSSSPLGLFFDHGLDACNTFVGTANLICMFGVPPTDLVSILVITTMSALPFFVTTWEEYYTHKLELPIVNGPTDAVLMMAFSSIATSYFGQEFWHYDFFFYDGIVARLPLSASTLEQLPESISNVNFFCAFLTVMTMREVLFKIVFVIKDYGIKTVLNLLPMVALVGLSTLIVHKNPTLFLQNQRLCLYVFSLTFFEMVTAMMLDHMTSRKYEPFRHTLTPLFILYTLVDSELPMKYITPYFLVYVSGLSSVIMVKAKIVIQEMCSALGLDIVHSVLVLVLSGLSLRC